MTQNQFSAPFICGWDQFSPQAQVYLQNPQRQLQRGENIKSGLLSDTATTGSPFLVDQTASWLSLLLYFPAIFSIPTRGLAEIKVEHGQSEMCLLVPAAPHTLSLRAVQEPAQTDSLSLQRCLQRYCPDSRQ